MNGERMGFRVGLGLLLALPPPPAQAEGLAIDHREVGCVAAGKFPRFEVRFDPADAVARARVHFKPKGWPHWYSVPMKQEGVSFLGVLPKPDKKLEKFAYYISVVDRTFTESRTPEYAPIVVLGPGGCQQNKMLALALKKAAQVIVNAPEGIVNAPLVPAGFSTDGVIAGAAAGSGAPAAGTAGTGAAAAGATAGGAAAGGGISTAVLVVGGVAVAGGAAAVAVKSAGGGQDEGGRTIEVTPQPLVRVPDGASAQFTAVAKDRSGNPISPQPRFAWSSSCVCVRVTQSGLATLSSSFGPGNCAAIMARDEQGGAAGQSHLGLEGATNCPPSQ